VLALAIGFATWAAPRGDWLDIPVTVLSFYFTISLLRRAIGIKNLLIDTPVLSASQRAGLSLMLVACIFLAMGLVIVIGLRLLAANNYLPQMADIGPEMYLRLTYLPRDAAALLLLASLGLSMPIRNPHAITPTRQKLFAALAVAGTIIAILLYWNERMILLALVYIAVSGVEAAQPVKFCRRMTSFPKTDPGHLRESSRPIVPERIRHAEATWCGTDRSNASSSGCGVG